MDAKTAIEQVYFDPANPGSYTSKPQAIRQQAQKLSTERVTLQDVKQFLNSNARVSITKNTRRRFPRVPIFASCPHKVWACDSAYMKELATKNDGKGYIVLVVDVFSKTLFARLCKDLKAATVVQVLRAVIEEAGVKPEVLYSDLGGEYRNSTMQAFLQSQNIKPIYSRDPNVKCSIAERNIRYDGQM